MSHSHHKPAILCAHWLENHTWATSLEALNLKIGHTIPKKLIMLHMYYQKVILNCSH